MAWGAVMKTLRESVSDYLVMRRSMGYKVEGLTKLLSSFVAYSEARGVERVQKEIAGRKEALDDLHEQGRMWAAFEIWGRAAAVKLDELDVPTWFEKAVEVAG